MSSTLQGLKVAFLVAQEGVEVIGLDFGAGHKLQSSDELSCQTPTIRCAMV